MANVPPEGLKADIWFTLAGYIFSSDKLQVDSAHIYCTRPIYCRNVHSNLENTLIEGILGSLVLTVLISVLRPYFAEVF